MAFTDRIQGVKDDLAGAGSGGVAQSDIEWLISIAEQTYGSIEAARGASDSRVVSVLPGAARENADRYLAEVNARLGQTLEESA